jgi:hypothetical protein
MMVCSNVVQTMREYISLAFVMVWSNLRCLISAEVHEMVEL